jgi:hypothetical protein
VRVGRFRARLAAQGLALSLGLAAAAAPAWAAEDECPDTGLVPELTRLTQFKDGSGRTLDDVRYDIVIRAMTPPVCRERNRFVNATTRLVFDAQRGRAAASPRVQFSYFVAIMHRVTKEIIAKEVFPVTFDFPEGRAVVTIEEELEQVRFRLGKDEKPIYYAVLVGLQLSEEQLGYNRQRRGESPDAPRATAPALPTLPGFALPGQAPAASPAPPAQGQAPQQRPVPAVPQLPKPN